VRNVILLLLQLYLLVMFARAILSWFPIRAGTIWASVYDVVFTLTEPVLRPVRRAIPRTGMFDLSFIVVMFGIIILRAVIAGSA
jgi:YggT family protein